MAGEIEFLEPDPSPGQDESLPGPARHHAGRSKRVRLVTLLGVVALVAVAFISRIAASSSDTAGAPPVTVGPSGLVSASAPAPNTPTPTSAGLDPSAGGVLCGAPTLEQPPSPISRATPSDAHSPQPGVRTPDGPNLLFLCAGIAPPECPTNEIGEPTCTSTTAVPATLVQAVRAHLPAATVTSTHTEVIGGTRTLWSRTVAVRSGYTTISLVVERTVPSSGVALSQDDGSHVTTQQVEQINGHSVVVVVTAPSGSHDNLAPILSLARDARLASVA